MAPEDWEQLLHTPLQNHNHRYPTDLTSCRQYSVSQLPYAPAQLASSIPDAAPLSAFCDPLQQFVFLVSPTHVTVWDYAEFVSGAVSASVANEIPYTSLDPHGELAASAGLPLAAFASAYVATQGSGLILAHPNSGHVQYTPSRFLRYVHVSVGADDSFVENGGFGDVIPLGDGESISSLNDVDPAGVIAVTSRGNLFLIVPGKTGMHIEHLNPPRGLLSGLLGNGTLGSLGSSLSSGISAVSAQLVALCKGRLRSKNGEREVFLVSRDGWLHHWVCTRAVGLSKQLRSSDLQIRLISHVSPLYDIRSESFRIHDLCYVPQDDSLIIVASFHIYSDDRRVCIIFNTEKGVYSSVRAAHELPKWASELSGVPQIVLPPGGTAFVVFDAGVVLVDALPVAETASQAGQAGQALPRRRWEDVVLFNASVRVVGTSFENGEYSGMSNLNGIANMRTEISNSASNLSSNSTPNSVSRVLLFVQGFGVVSIEKFSVSDPTSDISSDISSEISSAMLESKLGQAVLYGLEPGNVLRFDNVAQLAGSDTQVSHAVAQLVAGIASGTWTYSPVLLESAEELSVFKEVCLVRLARVLEESGLAYRADAEARQQLVARLEQIAVLRRLLALMADGGAAEAVEDAEESESGTKTGNGSPMSRAPTVAELVRTELPRFGEFLAALLRSVRRQPTTARVALGLRFVAAISREVAAVRRFFVPRLFLSGVPFPTWLAEVGLFKEFVELFVCVESVAKAEAEAEGGMGTKAGNFQFGESVAEFVDFLLFVSREKTELLAAPHSEISVSNSELSYWENVKTSQPQWLQLLVKLGSPEAAFELAKKHRILSAIVDISDQKRRHIITRFGRNSPEHEKFQTAMQQLFAAFSPDLFDEYCRYFTSRNDLYDLLTEFPSQKEQLTEFLRREPVGSPSHAVRWIREFRDGYIEDGVAALFEAGRKKSGSGSGEDGDLEPRVLPLALAKLGLAAELGTNVAQARVEWKFITHKLPLLTGQRELLSGVSGTDREQLRHNVERKASELETERPVSASVLRYAFRQLFERNEDLLLVELVDLLSLMPDVAGMSGGMGRRAAVALAVLSGVREAERVKRALKGVVWLRVLEADITELSAGAKPQNSRVYEAVRSLFAEGNLSLDENVAQDILGNVAEIPDVEAAYATYYPEKSHAGMRNYAAEIAASFQAVQASGEETLKRFVAAAVEAARIVDSA